MVGRGLMSLYFAFPPAGLGVGGGRELELSAVPQPGGVGGCGDELGAVEVELALAWPFLG